MPRAAAVSRPVLTLAAALAIATPPLREVSAKGPPGNERLSDERLLSRWANPVNRSAIRLAASSDSRRVGRLHPLTEDGYPEVYLALRSHRITHGQLWIEIRIPARPNGQTGWVRRAALGPLHAVSTAIVSLDSEFHPTARLSRRAEGDARKARGPGIRRAPFRPHRAPASVESSSRAATIAFHARRQGETVRRASSRKPNGLKLSGAPAARSGDRPPPSLKRIPLRDAMPSVPMSDA
jgi:hypothetical protein